VLKLDEIWGNRDGSWDAIYSGYVSDSGYPIESKLKL